MVRCYHCSLDVTSNSENSDAQFEISTDATKVAKNLIFISGPARSGTSLLGNLIASFDSIEFSYEPNLLFTLLRLNKQIPHESWKMVYETYLYEDLFLAAVSGRSLNFRKTDESSVFNHKENAEIRRRLEGPGSKAQIQQLIADRRLAVKVPDVVDQLPFLSRTYPEMTIVIAIREPIATINSWLSKGWLSDKSLNGELTLFPFTRHEKFVLPHFIPPDEIEQFFYLSELDRIIRYLKLVYLSIMALPKKVVIRYEEICDSPSETVGKLSEFLKTFPTKKTHELMANIRPIEMPLENLSRISSVLLDEVRFFYEELASQNGLQER